MIVRLFLLAELPLNPRYERWRWQTFGITWLIYASFYLTRQSFGVAKVALENDPSVALHRADLGLVDSTYLTAYMLGQFVFGPLGDRFGPRRILLFGMALSVLAAVASGCLDRASGVCRVRRDSGHRSVDRLEQHVQDDELVVLVERARPRDRLVVHALHGGRGGRHCRFAGWMMEHFGHAASPGAGGIGDRAVLAGRLLGAGGGARGRARARLVAPAESAGRRRPAADRGVSRRTRIAARAGGVDPRDPAEDPDDVIREVLATPSIWLLAISYFSIKLARYAFYFWGPKYVSESLGQRCARQRDDGRRDADRRAGRRHRQRLRQRQVVSGPPRPGDHSLAAGDARRSCLSD